MPKEQSTPLSRGPGSVSPDFTAPSVPVATPGRQLDAPTTEQEAFRDAILSFGRGVASAVSARAQINNRIKALKEQSMRKTEADLNRAARGFQQRRLEGADKRRREILDEAGEKGMEWAEREFRSRMTNASSAQEARIWEQAWNGAAAQVDRSNAEAQRQSFNQAKMSMQEVGLALSEELQESETLQQTLTGDGSNIAARVQDWMLTRVQREVDMDKLGEEDAQFLIHQTIVQSARIADGLRGQHAKAVEDSNQRLGARQMEADMFSTMTGEQEPVHLREQIEVTLRDRFSHLTLEQQDDMVREMISSNLQRLASGDHGIDNFGSLDAARELINQTVNGRKVFDDAERAQLTAKLMEQSERTLTREFEARLSQARDRFTKVITTPTGEQVTRIDLDADSKLLTPDPETGISPLDRLADSLIGDIDPDDSPEAARLVGIVREQQRRMAASLASKASAKVSDWDKTVNVLTGGTSENPTSAGNTAWHTIPETRVLRGPRELAASGQEALAAEEERHLRAAYKEALAIKGDDPSIVDQWDGGVIGTDHPLREVADVQRAALWNHPDVVRNTGMPPALIREQTALLTSDNPADLRSFGNFASTLKGGAEGAWQKLLAGMENDSHRAAAIHVRTSLMRGQVYHGPDGEPTFGNPGDEAIDMDFLHSQVRALTAAPSRKGWLWARPEGQQNPSNAENLAAHWADMIRSSDDPAMYDKADWDLNREEMETALTRALSKDTALADWVNATMQSQSVLDHNLDEGQIAATLMGWMERDGLRLMQTGDSNAILLRDPAGHTGPAGGNLDRHAGEKLTTPYPPWARDVIGQALDAKPFETPESLQGLYLFRRKGVVRGNQILPDAERPLSLEDARVTGLLTAEYGNTPEDNQRRLDPRSAVGGAVLHATVTIDGERLQLPRAVRDVEFTYPDGSPGFIEEGQVISFVNSDFTPSPPPKRRSRTGGSAPTERMGYMGFTPRFPRPAGANIPEA